MSNIYPILATVSIDLITAGATLISIIQADQKAIRLIAIVLVLMHAALALCFKVLFFSYYAVKKIGPADPIDPPIPAEGPSANTLLERLFAS